MEEEEGEGGGGGRRRRGKGEGGGECEYVRGREGGLYYTFMFHAWSHIYMYVQANKPIIKAVHAHVLL